jgi:hypothetical protein
MHLLAGHKNVLCFFIKVLRIQIIKYTNILINHKCIFCLFGFDFFVRQQLCFILPLYDPSIAILSPKTISLVSLCPQFSC